MKMDAETVGKIGRVMTALSLVIGLALVLGGGYFIEKQREFIANSLASEGRVVENERVQWTDRNGSGSHTSYRAVVSFAVRSGQVFTFRDSVGMNPPLFPMGQSVTVLYDPKNPENAMIDRGTKNYLISGIAFGLGLLITLGALPRVFR